MLTVVPAAIEWPKISVGDREFTLRYAYSADFQLARWGKNLASANAVELAAAMAGEFTAPGVWKSAGFERAIDLADLMRPEDEAPLIAAVAIAVKNRYPELEVSARPAPGIVAPQAPIEEAPIEETSSSGSGPSLPAPADSVSQTIASGA